MARQNFSRRYGESMTKETKREGRGASLTDKHEQHWRHQLDTAKQRNQWVKNRKYGTLGPASPVRHIDPATYTPEKKKP
jgi:hypothetical protein